MNPDTRVRYVMTESVLSVDLNDRPSEVLRLIAGYPVHHLPVVSSGSVVGMISSADLRKLDAVLPRKAEGAGDYLDAHIRIAQLMTSCPWVVGPDDTVAHAGTLFATHGIHALPVVDVQGVLIGILTTTDLIHAAFHGPFESARSPAAAPAASEPDLALHVALEKVLETADRYLLSGQPETLHSQLLNAVEKAKALQGSLGGARASAVRL